MTENDLGGIGEGDLFGWCPRAGIVCNPHGRDRYGWDFHLEWKPSDDTQESRSPRWRAFVQVKEDHTGDGKIEININTTKELVFDSDPAFFYIVRVENSEITQRTLLHLGDRETRLILGGIRKKRLGKKTTTKFKLSTKSFSHEVSSPAELRQAMEEIIGEPEAYRASKQRLTATVGFDERPLRISYKADFGSVDELLDFHVGKTPQLAVSNLSIVETRFGVEETKVQRNGGVEVSMGVPNVPALLKLSGDRAGQRIAVNCAGRYFNSRVSMPSDERWKIRFVSDFFSYEADYRGVRTIKMTTTGHVRSSDTRVFGKLVSLFDGGPFDVSLGSTNENLPGSDPVKIQLFFEGADEPLLADGAAVAMALESMEAVVRRCSPDPAQVEQLSIGHALTNQSLLTLMAAICEGLPLRLEQIPEPTPGETVFAPFAMSVPINQQRVAVASGIWSGTVRLDGSAAYAGVNMLRNTLVEAADLQDAEKEAVGALQAEIASLGGGRVLPQLRAKPEQWTWPSTAPARSTAPAPAPPR